MKSNKNVKIAFTPEETEAIISLLHWASNQHYYLLLEKNQKNKYAGALYQVYQKLAGKPWQNICNSEGMPEPPPEIEGEIFSRFKIIDF